MRNHVPTLAAPTPTPRAARAVALAALCVLAACQGDGETGDTDAPDTDTGSLPELYINEFMASNSATIADETGAFPDWIEIWNGGDAAADLGGLTLTDDLADAAKWSFPSDLTLDAGDFLLVWADGDTADGPLHAGFKLDSEVGEQIGLFSAAGTPIDQIEYQAQAPDVSMARQPDGTGDFSADETPTPGASNQ